MKKRRKRGSARSAAQSLASFFRRNGYVRTPNLERIEEDGWDRYKKGCEVRLVAESSRELKLIRRLLREAGFEPGRPFEKGNQYRQPIYGRDAVVRFMELVVAQVDEGE